MRIHISKNSLAFSLLLLAVAAGSGVYVAHCMAYAPWGYSDSAAFFSAARNLASGHGISVSMPGGSYTPLNLHAPFLPMLLSPFARLNLDLIDVMRVLDVSFWGLFVFLSGWLFYAITGRSIASLGFALGCAFSYPLAALFTSLMSEPLALVLGVPGFLFLILGISRDSLRWIIVGAVLGGLAVLTRFAFEALSLAGLLAILMLKGGSWKKRGVWAIIYGILSGFPLLLWTLYQRLQHVTTGGRSIVLDGDTVSKAVQFFRQVYGTMKYWFPYRTNMIPGVRADYFTPILSLAFLVMIVAAIVISIRRYRAAKKLEPTVVLMMSMIFYAVCYSAVLLPSFALSSVAIDINERMLAPLIPAAIGILLAAAVIIGSGSSRVVLRNAAAVVVTLFFVVFNYTPMREYLISSSNYPGGFASPAWKGQPIFDRIDQLPSNTVLVSNAPDVVLFYTNRYPYCLSEGEDVTGCYSVQDLENFTTQIEGQCGAAVLFPGNKADQYENYPDPVTGETIDGLESQHNVFYSGDDGYIIFLNQCDISQGG